MLRKLAVIRVGDAILMVSIVVLGLAQFFTEPTFKSFSTLSSTVGFALIAAALAMTHVGLVLVVAVPGDHRSPVIFALVLQVIATIGVASFIVRVIQLQFVGGLLPLFGAAAFAMLLTSQAIVALVIRTIASQYQLVDGIQWSYGAVIGYALCATVASSWSLHVIPPVIPPRIVLTCMCVFALAGTASRFHAISVLRSRTNSNGF